jgi:hypothetical protein
MPKDAKPSNAALAIERLLARRNRSDDERYDDERVRVDSWGNRFNGTQGRYGAEARARWSADNWGRSPAPQAPPVGRTDHDDE